MTEYYVPELYCRTELTGTITGKIVNQTQLMLILYDAGLYQPGPKQKKKRRTKKNGKQNF